MTTDPRIEKLPRWAQQRIENLEGDLSYWKAKANEGPEDSDTFADRLSEPGKPLGRGTGITFVFSGRVEITARLRGSYVEIASSGLSATALAVQPQSSNVLRVAPQEWWK